MPFRKEIMYISEDNKAAISLKNHYLKIKIFLQINFILNWACMALICLFGWFFIMGNF